MYGIDSRPRADSSVHARWSSCSMKSCTRFSSPSVGFHWLYALTASCVSRTKSLFGIACVNRSPSSSGTIKSLISGCMPSGSSSGTLSMGTAVTRSGEFSSSMRINVESLIALNPSCSRASTTLVVVI